MMGQTGGQGDNEVRVEVLEVGVGGGDRDVLHMHPSPSSSKHTTSSTSFQPSPNTATHHHGHTWGSCASCPLCSHRMCRVMDPSPPATAPKGVDAAADVWGATSTRVLDNI